MSFPKRITSNLKRSFTVNSSPKDRGNNRRNFHHQQATNNNNNNNNNGVNVNNNNNNNNTNNGSRLNRQQSAPQQNSSCRSPTRSSNNLFTFKIINHIASNSDQGIQRKMDDGTASDHDVVDTTRLMTSSRNVRARGRQRKRSNTIDVGAILEFRSTVRKKCISLKCGELDITEYFVHPMEEKRSYFLIWSLKK